jgi:flagellar hook assembly protein FlgD
MIHYRLAQASAMELAVYDANGRLVRRLASGSLQPPVGGATWDGRDNVGRGVAGGVYFCRLTNAGKEVVARLVRVR